MKMRPGLLIIIIMRGLIQLYGNAKECLKYDFC